MNFTDITPEMIANLAMQAEITDPVDWGMLSIEEHQAYVMMANSVKEQMNGVKEDQRMIVAMATMTKLLVENFVLNLKITGNMK